MTHLKLMLVTTAMIAATTSFASADGKLWTVTGDYAACTDFSDFLDVGSGREVITSTESCIRLREGTLVYLDTAKDGPVNLKYSCLRPFQWFTSKRCYWTNTWAIMPEDIGSSSEHVTTPASQPAMQLAPPAPVQATVPAAPVQAIVPAAPVQATALIAPPTLSAANLPPLSSRLAEINQLARQSLPIIVRHCGSDASCRKQQTTAMQELASKEAAVAKALRNPTTYTSAVVENDTINACLVMWRASEDFAATMQCINDATPTTMAEHR